MTAESTPPATPETPSTEAGRLAALADGLEAQARRFAMLRMEPKVRLSTADLRLVIHALRAAAERDSALAETERLRDSSDPPSPKRRLTRAAAADVDRLREREAALRRVQVYDGDGDCTLDVIVMNEVEADWLRDFLDGQQVGDVYVDVPPRARVAPERRDG